VIHNCNDLDVSWGFFGGHIFGLKPVETLAPVFGNVMRLLRSLYAELDDRSKDLADSTAHKERILIELYDRSSSSLVRKEIILVMAKWQATYWLSDILRKFGSLTKWEKKAFIVAAHHMNDEGDHWLNSIKHSLAADERTIRKWYKDRLHRNPEVPL
jgi:hypothetical protein